jgi:hypothetical protein
MNSLELRRSVFGQATAEEFFTFIESMDAKRQAFCYFTYLERLVRFDRNQAERFVSRCESEKRGTDRIRSLMQNMIRRSR